MKVQTKIILLLVVLTAIFFGGLSLLRRSAQRTFQRIATERAVERARFFDAFVARQGETLETFVGDATTSSPMVRAIADHNLPWLVQNIDNDSTWNHYDARAVWVYRPDRTLVYSKNLLAADDELHDLPLPPAVFDALEHQRLMHFFLQFSQGYLEIRAATVHESIDGAHRDTPQGFFFAGRLWNGETLKDFTGDTDNHLQFLPAIPPAHEATTADDADRGIISFTRTYPGWDGRPVTRILVCNDSDTIGELSHSTHLLLALLVGFALALLLVLTVLLTMVGHPAAAPHLPDAQDRAARAHRQAARHRRRVRPPGGDDPRVLRPAREPHRGGLRAQERPGSPPPERRTAPAGAEDGGRRAAGRRRGARLQ